MTKEHTNIGQHTFVLMPKRRTFFYGMSEILNFSPLISRFETTDSETEADARAITSDWRAIGNDLEIAYIWGHEQTARQQ